MDFTWTDEQIDRLRTLHAEGLSFSDIGARLGCTRNAAIGKAGRIGLAKRGAGFRQADGQPGAKRQRRRRPAPRMRSIASDAAPGIAPVFVPEAEPSCDPVALFDLQFHHCRWPVSGEGAATLFCAASKINGSSYCAYHFARSCNRTARFDRAEDEIRRRLQMRRAA